MYGTSNADAMAVFNRWRCNETHCSNHSKHCFRISSIYYLISSEDAEDWIKDELAGLDSPPPSVWARLLSRKSFDLTLKKRRVRGGMGCSNAAEDRGNSGPIINYYIGGKHQSGRRHYYDSSAESSPENLGRWDWRTAPMTI